MTGRDMTSSYSERESIPDGVATMKFHETKMQTIFFSEDPRAIRHENIAFDLDFWLDFLCLTNGLSYLRRQSSEHRFIESGMSELSAGATESDNLKDDPTVCLVSEHRPIGVVHNLIGPLVTPDDAIVLHDSYSLASSVVDLHINAKPAIGVSADKRDNRLLLETHYVFAGDCQITPHNDRCICCWFPRHCKPLLSSTPITSYTNPLRCQIGDVVKTVRQDAPYKSKDVAGALPPQASSAKQ
jgi:hypothetical protein